MLFNRNFVIHFVLWLAAPAMLAGCDVAGNEGLGKSQQPDPVTVDFPVVFIARAIPLDEEGCIDQGEACTPPYLELDILDPAAFHPGAKLIFKDRASTAAPEINLTQNLFSDVPSDEDDDNSALTAALYDIKDLQPSPDGSKMLFALRAPEDPDADDDEQPKWNLWELDVATHSIKPLMDSFVAEQGQDVSPRYLPDGRIVFSSNRQKRTKAILLDEGKPQYSGLDEDLESEAYNLHTLTPETGEITQLTFNPSHDLQPTVLSDGRISFLRWDNTSGKNQLSFYVVNADGTQLERFYGYNTQTQGEDNLEVTFWNAREVKEGQLLVNLRKRESRNWGGDIVTINTAEFTDNTQVNPQNPGSGEAQKSISPIPINITEATETKAFSLGGFYNSAYPMNDGTDRLIVSWSPCRILATDDHQVYPCTDTFLAMPDAEVANPSFGLWILNTKESTQLPLKPPSETEIYTEAVVLSPQTFPRSPIRNIDSELANEGVGILNIRNVYDLDGSLPAHLSPRPHQAPPEARPARFIRLVKTVPIPDDDILDFDRSAFGISRGQLMRDILGYVPIEADGSAQFKVPANVPFMINLVDAKGKRLPNARHNNWISIQNGETRDCVGCHRTSTINNPNTLPHGRSDAEAPSAYAGAPLGNIALTDAFGTPLPAPVDRQTMAEHFADNFGARTPTIDMLWQDPWSPQSNAHLALSYAAIAPNDSTTLPPYYPDNLCQTPTEDILWQKPSSCQSTSDALAPPSWTSICRITINYIEHIQPLWERNRRRCDSTDPAKVIEDKTCTSCHTKERTDEITGLKLAPAGNLFLTGEAADQADYSGDNTAQTANFVTSYAQLFFPRWDWEIDANGELAKKLESRLVDVTSLDDAGNEITTQELRLLPKEVNRLMTASGAINQRAFFDLVEGNDPIHAGSLSDSELRLIAEWLDLGAQYYNNPFVAPLDD